MNAPPDLRMDNRMVLHRVPGREGRFALERGRVVRQMSGRSRNHSVLVARLADVKPAMAGLYHGIGHMP